MFYYYVANRYSSKWQAIYGSEIYPDGYSIHGIDVSHHQGDIDWEKASRAEVGGEPISFVIIKATEGVSHIDENFNALITILSPICRLKNKLSSFLSKYISKRAICLLCST